MSLFSSPSYLSLGNIVRGPWVWTPIMVVHTKAVRLYINGLDLSSELQACSPLPFGYFHLDISKSITQNQTCGFPLFLALFLSTSAFPHWAPMAHPVTQGHFCKMPSLQSFYIPCITNKYVVTPFCSLLFSRHHPNPNSHLFFLDYFRNLPWKVPMYSQCGFPYCSQNIPFKIQILAILFPFPPSPD